MKTFNKVLLSALATLFLFAQSAKAEDHGIRAFYETNNETVWSS